MKGLIYHIITPTYFIKTFSSTVCFNYKIPHRKTLSAKYIPYQHLLPIILVTFFFLTSFKKIIIRYIKLQSPDLSLELQGIYLFEMQYFVISHPVDAVMPIRFRYADLLKTRIKLNKELQMAYDFIQNYTVFPYNTEQTRWTTFKVWQNV